MTENIHMLVATIILNILEDFRGSGFLGPPHITPCLLGKIKTSLIIFNRN